MSKQRHVHDVIKLQKAENQENAIHECDEFILTSSTASTSTSKDHRIDTIPEIRTTEIADDIRNEDGNEEDRPKTPTSPGSKILGSPACPPAPMKPKSGPNRKRKVSIDCDNSTVSSSRTSPTRLLDFSKEVESMFPRRFQADLGRKIKKSRSV